MTTTLLDYSKTDVPADYKCCECGATNCKLWREYQCFSKILLRCAECAAKSEKKDVSDIDADGRRSDGFGHGGRTDQIGWYVPAVPMPQCDGYHGYTSVPEAGVSWWRRLPTRPVKS